MSLVLDTRVTDFHPAVAATLSFPDYYGANLDALAECLRDVDPRTRLTWTGWRRVRDVDPHTFEVAHRLLDQALTLTLAG